MAYSLFFLVLQGLSEIQAKHSYLEIILKSVINRNDSITHRSHSKCVCYMQTQTSSQLVPFAPGDSVTDSTAFKSSCDSPSFLNKDFSNGGGGTALKTKSWGISLPQKPSSELLSLFQQKQVPRVSSDVGGGSPLPVSYLQAFRLGSMNCTVLVGCLACLLPKGTN